MASTTVDGPQARLNRRVIIGVFATVGLLTLGFTISESLLRKGKGWVQVECVHRCRVEGMDCRPPGSVGSWQPPGTYTVEAYDPEAPTGWTPVSIEVKAGERVTLQCNPPGGPEPAQP